MAIYHLTSKIISRGKGQSAIASAAYRSGEKLYSERYGESNFYSREVAPENFILKPEHAPNWTLNRERLWNEVEEKETSNRAQLAREIEVALPNELNNSEQYNLVKEYIHENFVAEGMVADASIHRDDVNNPHCHIMLTMRPFDKNGRWGNKQKKIYIYDESGEKVRTKKGNIKSQTVKLTDWDSKEKLDYWRKNWAEIANKYLEINGFTDRISEKSYTEQGIDREPTIHEGYVARQMEKRGKISERSSKNRQISDYNLASNKTKEKEERQAKNVRHIIHKEYADDYTRVSKSLSPNEKRNLSEITKNLKIYVNYENLIDKERMLNNWTDKVELNAYVNLDNADEETIENIQQTSKDIETGKDILERQADRIYQKYYPEFAEKKDLGTYYKIALADKTLKEDKVLNPIEIQEVMEEAKDNHANFMMKSIAKKPYIQPAEKYQKNIANLKEKMDSIEEDLEKQGQTVQTASDNVKYEYKDLMKKARIQLTALKILNKYYSDTIRDKYPTYDVNSLKINDKEQLSKAIDYFGNDLSIEKIERIANGEQVNKFNTHEQKIGLTYLHKYNNNLFSESELEEIQNNYQLKEIYDVVTDKSLIGHFLNEVSKNGDVLSDSKFQFKNHDKHAGKINLSFLMQNFNLYEDLMRAQVDNLRNKNEAKKQKRKQKNRKTKSRKNNRGL